MRFREKMRFTIVLGYFTDQLDRFLSRKPRKMKDAVERTEATIDAVEQRGHPLTVADIRPFVHHLTSASHTPTRHSHSRAATNHYHSSPYHFVQVSRHMPSDPSTATYHHIHP